jgi:transcriptional regulator with GAF, ATPase, and Fis domain
MRRHGRGDPAGRRAGAGAGRPLTPGGPARAAPSPDAPPRGPEDVRETVGDVERQRIFDALGRTQGNLTRAAELLGLPRRTLSYRMDRLGIRPQRG